VVLVTIQHLPGIHIRHQGEVVPVPVQVLLIAGAQVVIDHPAAEVRRLAVRIVVPVLVPVIAAVAAADAEDKIFVIIFCSLFY
jgi:hypothetical protein